MDKKSHSFAPIPVRGEAKVWLDVFNKKHRTKYTSLKQIEEDYDIIETNTAWYLRKIRKNKGIKRKGWVYMFLSYAWKRICQFLVRNRLRILLIKFAVLTLLAIALHMRVEDIKKWTGFTGDASINVSPAKFYEYELEQLKKKVEPRVAYAETDKEQVKDLIVKYFGNDSEWALRVAKCESGYNPKAANKTSSARGVFQILEGTWISNRKAMRLDTNLDLRFDAEENIKTAKYIFDRRGAQPWVCK